MAFFRVVSVGIVARAKSSCWVFASAREVGMDFRSASFAVFTETAAFSGGMPNSARTAQVFCSRCMTDVVAKTDVVKNQFEVNVPR